MIMKIIPFLSEKVGSDEIYELVKKGFPDEIAKMARINEIIQEGMLASAAEKGKYIPLEELQRRDYELDGFLGGSISRIGE